MEENVALDSTKQKKFVKSIRGIKKLIKKKNADPKVKESQGEKVKKGRVGKKKRPERGLVYLAHIPHGFYEHEMTQYFKQFGVVTNARVIKSKRTGRSKGYAFVQFKEPAVAQIVADTMNNYLMGKRLIKAAYIEPEKQKRRAFRRHWNAVNNPGNNLRMKMKKEYNENKDNKGELQRAKKLLSNINKTKKKLAELGINYDFFTPVDMPEVLANKKQVKVKDEESKENINVNDKKSKNNKKGEVPVVEDKKPVVAKESKGKVNKVENKVVKETVKSKAAVTKESIKTEKNKKLSQNVIDKNTQKQKKQNLKDKGVTPLEDFIKVKQNSDDESDSSLDFDSDEYEKMMEQEDDEDSEASGDDSDEDDAGSEEVESDDANDESEIELPKKKKLPPPEQIKKAGKQKPQQKAVEQKPQQKKPQQKPPQQKPPQLQQTKRKALQNTQSSPKMPKFEKQMNQKPRNKQFKKKK